MSGHSLWWIDWSLHGKAMGRETAGRLLMLFLVSAYFLTMLLSGGVDRFLSEQYTITAVLRIGVSDEEGSGIAGKTGDLSPVRRAEYRDPEQAWKEFLAVYPGLESIRGGGRNPLPGYVEIRLRHDRMSEAGIAEVRSALDPLPQVEKVLSGAEVMPRLLRMKRWANALLWTGFSLLCLACAVILGLQEDARASRILPDVAFLAERGVPRDRIASRRAASAFATGGILVLLSAGAAGAALFLLSDRIRPVRLYVGQPQELFDPGFVLPLGLFFLSAAAVQGLLSAAGWRRAAPRR